MTACARCGELNPPQARFCPACGTSLAGAPARPREVRKIVTVLFCDVVSSTELGEMADPETVRRVMMRYFDEMRAVIVRHGGTVEKFIGDEVMAVFGVPVAHEDDALRAVRAGAEMQKRLGELNEELAAGWGVRLEARIGINTGPVVAGDASTGQTFVTGDPVNVAKRLEQAAAPGQLLIGKATYPLVRGAVKAGPLETFAAKGKRDEVGHRRIDEIDATAPGFARDLDAPLVGRAFELAELQAAFDRAVADQSTQLLTVLGPAGIGKSRLAAELVDAVGDRATSVTGRCPAYGDGITFRPLAQIVREAGGEEALEDMLAGEDEAERTAERLRGTLRASPAEGSTQETFWAVRKLLETLARKRPLIVRIEDVHWAEPTFLDLIEYLVGWSRGAPILLLCLARPELLDSRSSWVGPQQNASLLVLDPLSPEESAALLERLGGDADVSPAARARIADAAEGNPLFVEQMVAMLGAGDDGADDLLSMPPSIQALLAERLDRLSEGERAVIERAAVVGKEFWRGAVLELTPAHERGAVGSELLALVRKGLVRPDTSIFASEDAFRFRHGLIRDATYDGIAKEVLGDLHERFAGWLELHAGERAAELDEMLGYHLEQAYRYREQLGPVDAGARDLATRAAAVLVAAGRRAFAGGDMPAAARLLTRATLLLLEDDRSRLAIAPELGAALLELGEWTQADGVLARAIADADALGEHRIAARARLERATITLRTTPEAATERIRPLAEQAIALFEAEGDDVGLAKAWRHLSRLHWMSSSWGAQTESLERALVHARRAGDRREEAMILAVLSLSLYWGPTPVWEAVRRCQQLLTDADHDRTVEAGVTVVLGGLQAMRGRFDEARALYEESKRTLADLGLRPIVAAHSLVLWSIEMLAGNPAVAEREARWGYETLLELGEKVSLSTLAALVAEASYAQGRLEEAERFACISDEAAASTDVASQVLWRTVYGKVIADRGDVDEAVRILREAVRLARTTDALNLRADALVDLAGILDLTGDSTGTTAALSEAVRLYIVKGNEVSRERAIARQRPAGPTRGSQAGIP